MLHPFMPFITEEIYTKLPNAGESIMISDYPKADSKFNFEKEEKDLELVKEIITGVRNLRANMNVAPSKKASMIFVTNKKDVIEEGSSFIEKLAGADKISCQEDKTGIPENAVSLAVEGIEIYIPFDELVDIDKEIERLEKEALTYTNEINRAKKMLDNPGFTSKAPQDKIDAEKAKITKYEELLKGTNERLESLRK
jgi:valyl-tRNA synthetase